MTKTHQLLDLMAHGNPVTCADLVAATGWPLDRVHKVIHFATTAGYATSLPHAYVITSAGIERQKFKPVTDPEKMARSTEARRAKRLAQHQANSTETMVQKSVRTNPNSVFNLARSDYE